MHLKLFNTLTRQKELFRPAPSPEVRMYVCGPTVYDLAHIGNLRSFTVADLLYRTLRAAGYAVEWVMNITDIDDKTIRGAKNVHGDKTSLVELKAYTDGFYRQFLSDLRQLNLAVDDIQLIKVTDVIPQIQAFILDLLNRGYAYTADDGTTYFSVDKYQADFGDYGKLVGDKFLEGKKVGARVKVDEYEKDNLNDFALWKKWDPNEDARIFWDHPTLGRGRPGWHIECSAINRVAFNGSPTTIHMGGIDLLFPHHTNEIAQSQPFYKPFCLYWIHTEYLQVDGRKMAKRENNFYTLADIEARGFKGVHLRYSFLCANYRVQQNFTWENLEAARQAYRNLTGQVAKLFNPDGEPVDIAPASVYANKFFATMADDLNVPQALAIMWELIKDSSVDNAAKLKTIEEFDTVLGLDILHAARHIEHAPPVPAHVIELAELREGARKTKNWAEADRLRAEIRKEGYLVSDTPEGPELLET